MRTSTLSFGCKPLLFFVHIVGCALPVSCVLSYIISVFCGPLVILLTLPVLHLRRLAEELEQRTDVRGSGMHGFYANLLTKNVAMGGNVEHSVSVYTAGGMRQNRMLDDGGVPKPVPEHSVVGRNGHAQSSEQEDHSDVDTAGISSVYRDAGHKRGAETSEGGIAKSRRVEDADDATSSVHQTEVLRTSPDGAAAITSQPAPAPSTATHPIVAISAASTTNTTTAAAPAPVADKTEVILSAKDRYLARKRAQEQG
jgi:hypothetical protein